MSIALLIHAHRDVEQVNRLIDATWCPEMVVYVHLDRKSSISPAAIDRRAHMIERRIAIHWGDYSQVQATLHSIREISARHDFEYLVFTSGQDYPVWPGEEIVRFLRNAKGHQHLHNSPLDAGGWKAAAHRVEYFYGEEANRLQHAAYGCLRVVMRSLSLKRSMVGGLKPYGGSQWFNLSRECVADIMDYVDAHPEYCRFMKRVYCVDEIFFQTLVLNSRFAQQITNSSYRYVDWSESARSLTASPKYLNESDFDQIVASGAMFCRKVEPGTSDRLMTLLDEYRRTGAARGLRLAAQSG